MDSPRPVPLPGSLVEKNGSTARAASPRPCRPHRRSRRSAGRGRARARPGSAPAILRQGHRQRAAQGMASRALTARFSSASSSWCGSTLAGGRRSAPGSRSAPGPTERCSRSSRPRTRAGRSTGRGWILPPGEGEQALGQRGAALGRLDGARDQAGDGGLVRQPLAEQVEVGQHRHQQVVEVVRHAAGELAHRLHLLRLEQLGQGHLPLVRARLDPALELGVEPLQLGLGRGESSSALRSGRTSRHAAVSTVMSVAVPR